MNQMELQEKLNYDCRTKNIQLQELIGSGAFSNVYIYNNESTNDSGIVKVIDVGKNYCEYACIEDYHHVHFDDIPDFKMYLKKAQQEFMILNNLKPNDFKHIVPLNSFEQVRIENGNYLILLFMPYIPQKLDNLQHTLMSFNEDDVLEMMIQCTEGLNTLHSNKIAHRDLKPDNIFMNRESGKIIYRLGDFGLSRMIPSEMKSIQTTTTIQGTPYYAAPEAFYGEASYSADIYSLGIVIYWLCNEFSLPHELLQKQHTSSVVIPRMKHGSESLWHIFQKTNEANPKNRYENAGQLLTDLYALKNKKAVLNSKSTDSEDAQAMYDLGLKYENGDGIPQDYQKAAEFYQKAANKGHAAAMRQLGFLYEMGNGVSKNYKKAIRLYEDAAQKGNIKALNDLGIMYKNGKGVPQNDYKAVEYYKKAAEKGYASAMNNLGFMYEKGRGVHQNYQKAMELYTKAADNGSLEAMRNLGFMYQNGLGVSHNYQKAFQWYSKAAENGNIRAFNDLGIMYEEGKGVTQNYQKAFECYMKAAENGVPYAMHNLGLLYEKGRGVSKNMKTAFQWYLKAAENGSTAAMRKVGTMYEQGIGVSKSLWKAQKWHLKAKTNK